MKGKLKGSIHACVTWCEMYTFNPPEITQAFSSTFYEVPELGRKCIYREIWLYSM